MMKSEKYIESLVKGDKHKQSIYDLLLESPKSRKVCIDTLGITKCQFSHYINYLLDKGHVKKSKGYCPESVKDKVDILRANPDYPFVASTIEEIVQKKKEEERQAELLKQHGRIIRNLDKPMQDDAWLNRKNRHSTSRIASSLDFI